MGAAIVEGLSWRWAFFINLPIGVFTVVAGAKHLKESSDPETRVPSMIGVGVDHHRCGVLSFGVVDADTDGWMSPRTIGTLTLGAIALAVFILHQRRTRSPVLDLELFKIGNFRWGNISMFVFGLAFSAMFFGFDPVPDQRVGMVRAAGRLRHRPWSRLRGDLSRLDGQARPAGSASDRSSSSAVSSTPWAASGV